MKETEVKMAPPWVQYVNELIALFGEDDDITITYNNDTHVVTLLVAGTVKADAITQLLPAAKQFGNVTLTIIVKPSNTEPDKGDLYLAAFSGNPALRYVETVDDVFSNPITYVVFEKAVVQYFNDDLSDVHGNRTTLYQDIAKDLFRPDSGVFFCTASDEDDDDEDN